MLSVASEGVFAECRGNLSNRFRGSHCGVKAQPARLSPDLPPNAGLFNLDLPTFHSPTCHEKRVVAGSTVLLCVHALGAMQNSRTPSSGNPALPAAIRGRTSLFRLPWQWLLLVP